MTKLASEIKHLIAKELKQELRQKYALGGILLYVVSTVFVCYLSFRNIIDKPTWNALFWIILLFGSINAVAKSFIQESKGRQLYFYTLVSPQAVIISKILYNSLLMLLLSLVCFLVYSLFIKNLVDDIPYFILTLVMGSIGFASVLSMVSAIASKTNSNFSLMAILSFPMLIPLLLSLIKVSKNAVDGLDRSLSTPYFGVLLLINLMVILLSFVLFPYLWRD
ncbi:MAG: heme exporter protein CcmB [Bacteroidetes bacterium]|jgi:heme exporter protein B|nr:heme exporter protein CcmB [Bacteroidota bacterium]MBK9798189.1 heme exporter protein CcmB [Bacteroidota bacterium]MBP6413642.1 heme exporter protein CcmB [Bacteroidia bacterium]